MHLSVISSLDSLLSSALYHTRIRTVTTRPTSIAITITHERVLTSRMRGNERGPRPLTRRPRPFHLVRGVVLPIYLIRLGTGTLPLQTLTFQSYTCAQHLHKRAALQCFLIYLAEGLALQFILHAYAGVARMCRTERSKFAVATFLCSGNVPVQWHSELSVLLLPLHSLLTIFTCSSSCSCLFAKFARSDACLVVFCNFHLHKNTIAEEQHMTNRNRKMRR